MVKSFQPTIMKLGAVTSLLTALISIGLGFDPPWVLVTAGFNLLGALITSAIFERENHRFWTAIALSIFVSSLVSGLYALASQVFVSAQSSQRGSGYFIWGPLPQLASMLLWATATVALLIAFTIHKRLEQPGD